MRAISKHSRLQKNRDTSRTAAVIVTFNKLQLLRRCIKAIEKQTVQPDEIIVVDNNSSDGTSDWLAAQSNITMVRQENLGSGGGQHTGIQTAIGRRHDWIWSMDDDGIPDGRALEQLLNSAKAHDLHCVNSLVLTETDDKLLAFELAPGLTSRADAEAAADDGLIYGVSNPFNGLLISRHLVSVAGNVRPELFIWGDEMEFQWRVQKAGFRLATCVNSIHFHPKDKFTRRKILRGVLGTMRVPPPSRRCYFYYRNQVYIYSHYRAYGSLVRFISKALIHALTTSHPLQQLDLYARGVKHGLQGDFSRNLDFVT